MDKYSPKLKTIAGAALVAVFAITLPAQARTVHSVSGEMCEDAYFKRDERIREDIEFIEQTHEVMRQGRQAHSECMRRINEAVGSAIARTGVEGFDMDMFFEFSSEACKKIQERVQQGQEKLLANIEKYHSALKNAANIYQTHKDGFTGLPEMPDITETGDWIPSWGSEERQVQKPPAPTPPAQTWPNVGNRGNPPNVLLPGQQQQPSTWDRLRELFYGPSGGN